MKQSAFTLIIITGILFSNYSCKHNSVKVEPVSSKTETIDTTGLFLIGSNIITEVIVKPDSLGDPWEIEKVKNFNGTLMFKDLFENIYNKKITVCDIITGKPLDISEVKKIAKEFGNDNSKIGKLQFLEDWYYSPSTNRIIKKLKSTSFAYEFRREQNLPVVYKALFKLNM
jgi:hypothetical protein